LDQRDLYNAIDTLGGVAVKLQAYRQVSESRDCLSGEGARRFGGRWNPPASFPTIYTSLELATAIAELERLMQRQGRTLRDLLPRRICEIDAVFSSVLDLRTSDSLAAVGLNLDLVRRNDLARCQTVGQAAHQLGFEGIVMPSASESGTNLAIFELNIRPESRVEVTRQYTLAVASNASGRKE
jgi:RES domain-containing protein